MTTGGHKTSAVTRPRRVDRAEGAEPGRRGRGSRSERRLQDLTSPIAMEHQLVTRRGNRWLLALLAVGVIGALAAALFVLPVQAWLRQQDDIDAKQAELAVLDQANTELQRENDRLQTPEGAKEAARDELGVVDEGEERVSVLPAGGAPLTLPSGWPYDTVTRIIAVRRTLPAAAVDTPADTTAPTSAPGTADAVAP